MTRLGVPPMAFRPAAVALDEREQPADLTLSGRLAFVGSLAFVTAVVIFDLATGPQLDASGTVALAPFLAATLCSVRRTLIVAVISIMTGAVLLVVNHTTLQGSYSRVFALVFVSAVALLAATTRERRDQRIADLTQVADAAQRALLIPPPPVVGPVRVATRYHSASSGALVGGDLYAVVETDQGARFMVGDVRGKGLAAVGQAAAVLSAFRELAGISPSLDALARSMEDRLVHLLHGEDFATAVLAEIDHNGTVRLVSCGHPPPVLIRGTVHQPVDIRDYATPFGLNPEPAVQQLSLRVGDRMLFYTDGLIETRSRTGSFISLDDALVGMAHDDLDGALGVALEQVERLAGDVRDDLALLLVEFEGGSIGGDTATHARRRSDPRPA